MYLALDTRLGRRVALKILPRTPDFLRDRIDRFEQETRAASALSHPNVCVIYEINETEEGDHYIAMEHVAGVTLRGTAVTGTDSAYRSSRDHDTSCRSLVFRT